MFSLVKSAGEGLRFDEISVSIVSATTAAESAAVSARPAGWQTWWPAQGFVLAGGTDH